jgi:peptide/nickel transport system permease protein
MPPIDAVTSVVGPVESRASVVAAFNQPRGRLIVLARYVKTHRAMQIGLLIVIGYAVLAVLAPLIVPYRPDTSTSDTLQPPSLRHLFGTDVSGFDILSRVLFAPRVDITIALTATLLALAIGTPLGVLAGFSRGLVSEIVSRVFDLIQAFPFFVLAMTLLAVLGPSVSNLIVVVAVVNAPIYLRLVKSQTLYLRERTFVQAARVAGNSEFSLMFRHLFPNALPPVLAQVSINVAWAVILTAGVSFVGAGVRAPTPEWGLMISAGASNMFSGQWWVALFPGAALALSTLGYALIADGLRDLADPTRAR